MVNVVRLAEFRNRELVAVCRELLLLAERGEATGLAFVFKRGRRSLAGLAGDYARNPAEGLSAAVRLEKRLLQEDDDEDSGS